MLDDATGRRARIVDHDVDTAERLGALLDKVSSVAVLSQVSGNSDDLSPGFLGDLIRHRFERFLAPGADRDIDAFLGERTGDALANALAATGHQRGLALELEVHRFLPNLL